MESGNRRVKNDLCCIRHFTHVLAEILVIASITLVEETLFGVIVVKPFFESIAVFEVERILMVDNKSSLLSMLESRALWPLLQLLFNCSLLHQA